MKKVIRAGTAEAAMVELLRKLKAMGYSPENLTVESGTASLKKHALRKLKMFFFTGMSMGEPASGVVR